ncbi:MAG: hypothetical protein ACM3SM_13795 [Bacteroidota bacterium]
MIRTLCFAALLLFYGCSKSTEPEEQKSGPYASLAVGDVRQFINLADSSTILYEIIDKTHRQDGQEIFLGRWSYGTDTSKRISYYCLKDGYLMSTELTPVQDTAKVKVNPFYEQRIAKIFPKDGDEWDNIVGDIYPEKFKASFIGKKITACGEFGNVYCFALDEIIRVYYAENFGIIASEPAGASDVNFLGVSLCYLRVGGIEKGRRLPPKDHSYYFISSSLKKRMPDLTGSYKNLINDK